MNLESLEQENKEYLKRLARKKILPIVGIVFISMLILFEISKTSFSIFFIFLLIVFFILVIVLSNFANLEKKDKLLDDFFCENHLIILEKIREINCHNSFEFSKEHLSEIIRDISYRIVKFRHVDNIEYAELMNIDGIYYRVTYKIVKNESGTNISKAVFMIKERLRIRQSHNREKEILKENLPLDLINVLYRIKRSKKKKPEKAFKIIKITGRT